MSNLTRERRDQLAGWLSNMQPALSALTARQYECVLLIFVEDWTQEEVAAEFGITQQAVNLHMATAIQKMREMFLQNKSEIVLVKNASSCP